jgi:AraC-like DNA-binding protein
MFYEMILFDTSLYTPGTRHPKHDHDTLQVSIVLSGSLTETVGPTTELARTLSVVAKDPGLAHADDFAAGATMARLVFKNTTLDKIIDDPSRATPWIWSHHAHVARPFLRIVQRTRHGPENFDDNDPDVTDLLAALTSRVVPTRGQPPRWLEEVMLELRHSWTPNTTVRDIAARAGVHPVYLARCVRRWYGTGVGEELRRLRLESAAATLASSRERVSSVAHANGFADESHMCRDFGRSLGVTPRRYRSIVKNSFENSSLGTGFDA